MSGRAVTVGKRGRLSSRLTQAARKRRNARVLKRLRQRLGFDKGEHGHE